MFFLIYPDIWNVFKLQRKPASSLLTALWELILLISTSSNFIYRHRCRYIIQLVKPRNFVEYSRNCDPYCEYCFHRFRTHRKLLSKLKQNFIFLNTGYDVYILNGNTSFTVQFEVIKWSCNPKITYTQEFFQTCGRTQLRHSSPPDHCGKICSLGTSFLLASGLINVSHSVNRTHQSPGEKENCASMGIMLGLHAFILFFFLFSFH